MKKKQKKTPEKSWAYFSNLKYKIDLNKQMSTKWNFLPCFIFLVPLKIIVQKSKIKHKTYSEILKKWESQVIKWDTQSSEELLLISFFLL